MLNYIWGGLIVVSLLFALTSDVRDFARDTFANGQPLPVTVTLLDNFDADARRQRATVDIAALDYSAHFKAQASVPLTFEAELIQTQKGRQLSFAHGVSVPEPLDTICSMHSRDDDCRGTLLGTPSAGSFAATVTFSPVRWVKMNAIAAAALEFAEDCRHHRPWAHRRTRAMDGAAEDSRGFRHSLFAGPRDAADAEAALSRNPQRSPCAGHDCV